jgi:hypothetical protein
MLCFNLVVDICHVATPFPAFSPGPEKYYAGEEAADAWLVVFALAATLSFFKNEEPRGLLMQ